MPCGVKRRGGRGRDRHGAVREVAANRSGALEPWFCRAAGSKEDPQPKDLGTPHIGCRRRRIQGVSESTTSGGCPMRFEKADAKGHGNPDADAVPTRDGDTVRDGNTARGLRTQRTTRDGGNNAGRGYGARPKDDAGPGFNAGSGKPMPRFPDVIPPRRTLIRRPGTASTGLSTGHLAAVEGRFLISAGVG